MAADIQFGDVEQADVGRARRPDRNRHYAVVPCGQPTDDDLPVFVDLDAICEMEEHALSNTSVELGGVMLGGQHEDEHGKPFVFVTDCLRARHYKSTKGSFKFTHDTWQQITRERDEFPAELQMVGWYHTHPGWGVFLSGMDTFICDHFFNRPLDLALVIDPCRQDRGFFQWTTDTRPQTRRTGGFYLVASRFRRDELQWYADQFQGEPVMHGDADRGLRPQRMPAPIVNISEGRPGWLGVAVVGVLVVQVFLTSLVAWRLLAPPGQLAQPAAAAGQTQLQAFEQRIDALLRQRSAEERLAAQRELLDRAIDEVEIAPGGLVTALEQQREESSRLRAAVAGFEAVEAEKQRLESAVTRLEGDRDRLTKEIDGLRQRVFDMESSQRDELGQRDEEIAMLSRELERLNNPPEDADAADEDDQAGSERGMFTKPWVYLVIGTVVVLIVAVAGIFVTWRRGPRAEGEDVAMPKSARDGRATGDERDEAPERPPDPEAGENS
jgi:proteasome lid subunit RPN8/RPN11